MPSGNSIVLQDIDQKQIVKLTQIHREKSVYALSIRITGHLEGKAEIQLADREKTIGEPKTLSGDVHLQLKNDWYGNTCLIHYSPEAVKSGSLKIQYEFKTL